MPALIQTDDESTISSESSIAQDAMDEEPFVDAGEVSHPNINSQVEDDTPAY